MSWLLDRPLMFSDITEQPPQPISCQNTATLGIDDCVYRAAQKYENHDGPCRCIPHHKQAYRPCLDVTEEYIKTHV